MYVTYSLVSFHCAPTTLQRTTVNLCQNYSNNFHWQAKLAKNLLNKNVKNVCLHLTGEVAKALRLWKGKWT